MVSKPSMKEWSIDSFVVSKSFRVFCEVLICVMDVSSVTYAGSINLRKKLFQNQDPHQTHDVKRRFVYNVKSAKQSCRDVVIVAQRKKLTKL